MFPEELPLAYSFSYGVFLGMAVFQSAWWALGAGAVLVRLYARRRWSA